VIIPFPVDDKNSQTWIVAAHSARVNQRAMSLIGDPQPSSNFAAVARLYPYEKVSDRVRAYLMAGIEHMLTWADLAAPLKFHEEQAMNVTLRPAYTLARAAIEASAQAVWLMNTRDPLECVRRHLSLMRWDLQEHRKSKLDQAQKEAIKIRETDLLRRVSQVFEPDDIKPPNTYLEVIRLACEADGLHLEPDAVERHWRAASGAAHGKFWPTQDLQRIHLEEDHESGRYRSFQLPDASAISEVLEVANTMSQYGVVLYAQHSGMNVAAVLGQAMAWVAEHVPLKPGATRADLMRLLHSVEWPRQTGT